MDSNVKVITRLMTKYARQETLTDEERRILEEWWQSSPENRELADLFADEKWVRQALASLRSVPRKEMWEEISRQLDAIEEAGETHPDGLRGRRPNWRTTLANLRVLLVNRRTAVLRTSLSLGMVVLIFFAGWLLHNKGETKRGTEIAIQPVAPPAVRHREKTTILTDSSGRDVDVGELPVGAVVSRAGSRVLKKAATFALAYEALDKAGKRQEMKGPTEKPADTTGNFPMRLAVGRSSGAYHLQMPDGNAVWLDSGASLSYYCSSRDAGRPYTLTGKGLFDIVKNLRKPLVIHLPNGKRIRVTGSKFFVDAEPDSLATRVANFSGDLRLFNNGDSMPLLGGQEAIVGTGRIRVKPIADSSAMMAWAGNSLVFHFSNTELDTALAQVAAWYGLKVSNPEGLKGIAFTADLPRPSSPESVVQIIATVEQGFVQVRLEQNVIVVTGWTGTK